MKLSIIIPCDETITTEKDLYQLLVSLNNQVAVPQEDVEIILTYSNPKAKFDFTNYPLVKQMVKLYCKNNLYIGAQKEYAYSISSGEYLLFLSKNLIFYSNISLNEICNLLSDKDYYILNTIQGYNLEDINFRIVEGNDVYGKIYSKKFLENNNLHFLDLPYNEDVYLNQRVLNLNAQFQKISDSITFVEIKPEPVFTKQIFNEIMITASAFYDIELINRQQAVNRLITIIHSVYYFMNSFTLSEADKMIVKDNLLSIINNYHSLYFTFDDIYKYLPNNDKEKYYEFLNYILTEEEDE